MRKLPISDDAQGWETYPVDVDCYAPVGIDRSLCSKLLSEQSSYLFVGSGGGIDILWKSQQSSTSRSTLRL
jgi:hypothetical protein